jgi:hypothetical protein
LAEEQVAMMWLEDWPSAKSDEDLAVAIDGIQLRVAEQVVGLKLIGLFKRKNIEYFSCIVYFSFLMMCQLFSECCKT